MSHVKHVFMSCLLALAAIGLQAAEPMPSIVAPDAKAEASAQQSGTPLTITVKQTDEGSWKTLYKVPVEISIKNNTDKEIKLDMPYFKNISLWNAKRIGCYIARIAMLTGITLVSINIYLFLEILAQNLFGLLTETSCTTLPNGRLNCSSSSKSLISFAYNPIGASSIAFLLMIHSKRSVFPTKSLQPHGKITMQGYISSADMQKIRGGLMPKVVEEVTA